MSPPTTLEGLLRAGTPLLDVRAPGEFARGTVPGAVNLPLLTDEERHRVGITYKQQGHDAAVALGHRLVSGEVRRQREEAWLALARNHPGAWVCCWRGGQRSEIAQQWLADRGVALPRVPGGFRALRRACLAVLEDAPATKRWIVLGGRTGSGKTALLAELDHAIDLEAIARHRGSAFGALSVAQPPPVTFENTLAVAFLQHRHASVMVEDESRTIGRLALPQAWHERMQSAPLAVLHTPLDQRVANIVHEYVTAPLTQGIPQADLHARYNDALRRIERRLGGARRTDVQAALERGFGNGDHGAWVERLLVWYYDPMYDHQLARKQRRVVAEGDAAELRQHLSADGRVREGDRVREDAG